MANWCGNFICISGPRTELELLIKSCTSDTEGIDFKLLLPCPDDIPYDELEEDDKQYFSLTTGVFDWHGWCIHNYGSRSIDNSCSEFMEIAGDSTTVTAQSAWGPIDRLFFNISTSFPNCKFHIEYEEAGNGVFGYSTIENGLISTVDYDSYMMFYFECSNGTINKDSIIDFLESDLCCQDEDDLINYISERVSDTEQLKEYVDIIEKYYEENYDGD